MTGAKGMLGTDLCRVLAANHEIVGYDIDDFDIVDRNRTLDAVLSASPDALIHLAAFTDVEACESERSKAFRINAIGCENVSAAAGKADARLIYLSTDYVFDGEKREPYVEHDHPAPLNIYGFTKLCGEYYAELLAARHLIIRTSWLFGPNGRNFVDTIVGKASQGGRLRVVNDQRGCPTYTRDLALGMKRVIEMGLEGTVHLTNSGDATWFELAENALAMSGIDCEIEPVSSESYPAKARRPMYSVLGSEVLAGSGVGPMPAWQDGLRDHLLRKGNPKES